MAMQVIGSGGFRHLNTNGPTGTVSLTVPAESLLIASVYLSYSGFPNTSQVAPQPFGGEPWIYLTDMLPGNASDWVVWYACPLRLAKSGVLDWPNATSSPAVVEAAPYYFLIAEGCISTFMGVGDFYRTDATASSNPTLTLANAATTGSLTLIHATTPNVTTVNVTGKLAGWSSGARSGAIGVGPLNVAGSPPAISISRTSGGTSTWSGGDLEILSKTGSATGAGARLFSGWGSKI